MLWQVAPSVIAGRNQDIEAEADMPYCIANGINVFRRKSGGGCVYADPGNLMISAVNSGNDKPFVFERFICTLALAFRKMGIDAWPSGRNDILVSGRKISGSAVYCIGSRNIVHSTLMYDVNLERLQKALTPSKEKLASKGISSVRQRVTNISGLTGLSLPEVESFLTGFFCDGEKILTDIDVVRIDEIMKTYADDGFIVRHTLWKH